MINVYITEWLNNTSQCMLTKYLTLIINMTSVIQIVLQMFSFLITRSFFQVLYITNVFILFHFLFYICCYTLMTGVMSNGVSKFTTKCLKTVMCSHVMYLLSVMFLAFSPIHVRVLAHFLYADDKSKTNHVNNASHFGGCLHK